MTPGVNIGPKFLDDFAHMVGKEVKDLNDADFQAAGRMYTYIDSKNNLRCMEKEDKDGDKNGWNGFKMAVWTFFGGAESCSMESHEEGHQTLLNRAITDYGKMKPQDETAEQIDAILHTFVYMHDEKHADSKWNIQFPHGLPPELRPTPPPTRAITTDKPTTPAGPTGPTTPTTPAGPTGPTGPTTPAGPTRPTTPAGPTTPTTPTTTTTTTKKPSMEELKTQFKELKANVGDYIDSGDTVEEGTELKGKLEELKSQIPNDTEAGKKLIGKVDSCIRELNEEIIKVGLGELGTSKDFELTIGAKELQQKFNELNSKVEEYEQKDSTKTLAECEKLRDELQGLRDTMVLSADSHALGTEINRLNDVINDLMNVLIAEADRRSPLLSDAQIKVLEGKPGLTSLQTLQKAINRADKYTFPTKEEYLKQLGTLKDEMVNKKIRDCISEDMDSVPGLAALKKLEQYVTDNTRDSFNHVKGAITAKVKQERALEAAQARVTTVQEEVRQLEEVEIAFEAALEVYTFGTTEFIKNLSDIFEDLSAIDEYALPEGPKGTLKELTASIGEELNAAVEHRYDALTNQFNAHTNNATVTKTILENLKSELENLKDNTSNPAIADNISGLIDEINEWLPDATDETPKAAFCTAHKLTTAQADKLLESVNSGLEGSEKEVENVSFNEMADAFARMDVKEEAPKAEDVLAQVKSTRADKIELKEAEAVEVNPVVQLAVGNQQEYSPALNEFRTKYKEDEKYVAQLNTRACLQKGTVCGKVPQSAKHLFRNANEKVDKIFKSDRFGKLQKCQFTSVDDQRKFEKDFEDFQNGLIEVNKMLESISRSGSKSVDAGKKDGKVLAEEFQALKFMYGDGRIESKIPSDLNKKEVLLKELNNVLNECNKILSKYVPEEKK